MRFSLPAVIIIVAFVAGTACRNSEITVTRVPKETGTPMVSAVADHAPAAHREVDWTVPSGWTEQPASGMRVGSFQIARPEGSVDVSVIPLSGQAGGELANVNRWRGQLGLPEVDAAGLRSIATDATAGQHRLRLVEFANDGGQRLLAAIVVNGDQSWFFKATGPDGAVKAVKSSFLAFVGSARFHNHD